MSLLTSILFIVIAAVAFSFTWGIKGAFEVGEKGAMLPGALFGLLFAAFSGSEVIRSNFFIFSAVGASAMFLGGTLVYNQTIELTEEGRGSRDFERGIEGLFIKGWCWFGLMGGFMALAFVAATDTRYTLTDLAIFFISAYPVSRIGIYTLNRPFNVEKNIFPRFFYAKTRRENWGGLVFLLMAFMIFTFVKRDMYSFVFCFFSGLSGGIAWVVAVLFYNYSRKRKKNGKYIFGELQENGLIDNWKIMECTFGAIGGIGLATTYCILHDQTQQLIKIIEINGELWSPFKNYGTEIMTIWLIVWALNAAEAFLWHKPARSFVIESRKNLLITEREYNSLINATDELGPPRWYRRIKNVTEEIDFWVYSFIPMCLSILGCMEVAEVTSVFLIYWVLAERVCFKEYLCRKDRKLIMAIMMSVAVIILVGQIAMNTMFPIFVVLLIYSLLYEIMELQYQCRLTKIKELKEKTNSTKEFLIKFGPKITVELYFIFCSIVLIIFGIVYLR